MMLELYRLGMSNGLLDPDDNPLTISKNRFARVIKKTDETLRQEVLEKATVFLNRLNEEQQIASILWERAFPELLEKDLTPRKIQSFG